ncbi:hypothetical protein VE04_09507 [Pseudogymnoascus sp. 24MN13]|nr:hypothetical protein VE04_09507 [Pseudogymnoascus sp. 24MN13]
MNNTNTNPLPFRPRAPGPPGHSRPVGIQKKEKRKEKERARKEKDDKKFEAMKAKEQENEEKERQKMFAKVGPKGLTHAQQLRKDELLVEKNGFAAKFRGAKAKIKERKGVLATIAEAMEGAEREKKELDRQYVEIVTELKLLGD